MLLAMVMLAHWDTVAIRDLEPHSFAAGVIDVRRLDPS